MLCPDFVVATLLESPEASVPTWRSAHVFKAGVGSRSSKSPLVQSLNQCLPSSSSQPPLFPPPFSISPPSRFFAAQVAFLGGYSSAAFRLSEPLSQASYLSLGLGLCLQLYAL